MHTEVAPIQLVIWSFDPPVCCILCAWAFSWQRKCAVFIGVQCAVQNEVYIKVSSGQCCAVCSIHMCAVCRGVQCTVQCEVIICVQCAVECTVCSGVQCPHGGRVQCSAVRSWLACAVQCSAVQCAHGWRVQLCREHTCPPCLGRAAVAALCGGQ